MKEEEKTVLTKGGSELIVYQIGQLTGLFEKATLKWDRWQEDMDKRVVALEKIAAVQAERDSRKEPLDLTRIVLGAFGLVSAALAIIAANQAGWIK